MRSFSSPATDFVAGALGRIHRIVWGSGEKAKTPARKRNRFGSPATCSVAGAFGRIHQTVGRSGEKGRAPALKGIRGLIPSGVSLIFLNSEVEGVNEALGSSIQIDWDEMKEEWNCTALNCGEEHAMELLYGCPKIHPTDSFAPQAGLGCHLGDWYPALALPQKARDGAQAGLPAAAGQPFGPKGTKALLEKHLLIGIESPSDIDHGIQLRNSVRNRIFLRH
jgi:hypothetical protein